jgi:4'-phosphopantetheinyl transferase
MDSATVYYLIQKISDVPEEQDWLAAGERIRVAGFRFSKRRSDWTLGRWTAKRALRSFLLQTGLDVPGYSEMEIRSAADGAPEAYILGKAAPIALAISHSGDQGFCAVTAAGVELGCDVEIVQMRDRTLIQDYFCEEETWRVFSSPVELQPLLTTLIWSAKESALKCLREGLRRDTRSVSVEPAGPGVLEWSPLRVRCQESARSFYGWWRKKGAYIQTVAAGSPLIEPAELPTPS